MREIFHEQLTSLGQDLVRMSELVAAAIDGAGRALLTADVAAADAVIVGDEAIDALQDELDDLCVQLLARQQPVATDLRIVVSGLRMSATLERMGDLARHIAEIARLRYPQRAYPPELQTIIESMAQAAGRVAHQVVRVLHSRDLSLAQQLAEDDDKLDALHLSVFAALADHQWAGSTRQTVDVTLLSRFYERFGDHGVSIAHRVEFLVTGDTPDGAEALA